MKALLCPVCNGRGIVLDYVKTGLPLTGEGPCHGCAEWGSRGWILVPEPLEPMPYFDGNDDGYKERIAHPTTS